MTHAEFEVLAALDALGVATSDEVFALREHAGQCFFCGRAREEYGEAVSLLAQELTPVDPPRWMRVRINTVIGTDGAYRPTML